MFLTCGLTEGIRVSYEEHVCRHNNFRDIFHRFYSGRQNMSSGLYSKLAIFYVSSILKARHITCKSHIN